MKTYNLLFVTVRGKALGQNGAVLQKNFGNGLCGGEKESLKCNRQFNAFTVWTSFETNLILNHLLNLNVTGYRSFVVNDKYIYCEHHLSLVLYLTQYKVSVRPPNIFPLRQKNRSRSCVKPAPRPERKGSRLTIINSTQWEHIEFLLGNVEVPQTMLRPAFIEMQFPGANDREV